MAIRGGFGDMISYFNNPYDKVSVNTLQYLFINDAYPMVVTRTSPEDDKGLWISLLPTMVLTDDSYKEYARIEDYKKITPENFNWLQTNTAAIMAGTLDPAEVVPAGVIIKEAESQ